MDSHTLSNWIVSACKYFLVCNLLLNLREIIFQSSQVSFCKLAQGLRECKETSIGILDRDNTVYRFTDGDCSGDNFFLVGLESLNNWDNKRV